MNHKQEELENELLDMYDYAWNKHKNTIGPFQLFISMVQNRHAGEQGTHQGETNKEEPPAHFEKRFCLFLALQKVTMVLKTF